MYLFLVLTLALSVNAEVIDQNLEDPNIIASTYSIVGNVFFEGSMVALVIASCILLILESPLDDPESRLQKSLRVFEIFVFVIFLLELVLRVFSVDDFFKNYLNILDIVLIFLAYFLILFAPLKNCR